MVVIGVTGGLGTGKSTVARLFQKLGARVLDADQITHDLMEPRTQVSRKIRRRFGEGAVLPSGRIDRKALGASVFRDRRALKDLCAIIHPAVRRKIGRELKALGRRRPRGLVVLDVPLLVEASGAYPWDALVVVSAPYAQVLKRLKRRSGWTRQEIRRRQSFQMPPSQKVKRADFVVENGGSLQATRRQVVRIFNRLVEKGEERNG